MAYCDNNGHSVGDAFFMDNHGQCRPCSYNEDSSTTMTTREDIAYPSYKYIGNYYPSQYKGIAVDGANIRMYAGKGYSDSTNTFPDGTQLEYSSYEKMVQECAKACSNFRVNGDGPRPKGFFIGTEAQSYTGRCYCSMIKMDDGTPNYNTYDGYDFVDGYSIVTSGTCASNGFEKITTAADCNAAQNALGLVDQNGDGANTVSQSSRASGCIYSNSLMNIMLNTHSNSNACGSGSHSFVCVCKGIPKDVHPDNLDTAYHAVKPVLQHKSATCNKPKATLRAADHYCNSYGGSLDSYFSVGFDADVAPEICAQRCRSQGYYGFFLGGDAAHPLYPAIACACSFDGCNSVSPSTNWDAYRIEPDFYAMHFVDTSKKITRKNVQRSATALKELHTLAKLLYADVEKNTNTNFPACEKSCRDNVNVSRLLARQSRL